ncbi:hypothetical protein ACLMAJ_27105 [Nocardia sp. KC 131]|uniref:hypothetical protein n=1 Tax=Nocardia arseniciresistens TaxID=3392119 RepID=UPI00398ED268
MVNPIADGFRRITNRVGEAFTKASRTSASHGAGDPRTSYTPSAAEQEMQARRLVSEHRMTKKLPPHNNDVFIMRSQDNKVNVYKPASGEKFGEMDWIPHVQGELAKRELGAFRMDQLFGFGRVPPGALIDGTRAPHGAGFVQQFVKLKRGVKKWNKYSELHQQQVAVLHYVIGNADGHHENYRPKDHGDGRPNSEDDLVAFDHGYSFPEKPDAARGGDHFRNLSDSVRFYEGKRPLREDVLSAVDAVRPEQVRSALGDIGLSDSAIEGVLTRLAAVKKHRMIPDWDLSYSWDL